MIASMRGGMHLLDPRPWRERERESEEGEPVWTARPRRRHAGHRRGLAYLSS